MEKTDIDGLSEYLGELFSGEIFKKLQNVSDRGVVVMRELSGEQTDDLGILTKDVAEEMPTDLLPIMMKIAINAENTIAPDSRDEETMTNLLCLAGALFTMASMTIRFLKIENDVNGLTID